MSVCTIAHMHLDCHKVHFSKPLKSTMNMAVYVLNPFCYLLANKNASTINNAVSFRGFLSLKENEITGNSCKVQ